jgi:hypothetical protein
MVFPVLYSELGVKRALLAHAFEDVKKLENAHFQ